MATRRNFLVGAAGLCGAAVFPVGAISIAHSGSERVRSVLFLSDRPGPPQPEPDSAVERRALSLDLAADPMNFDGAALLQQGHTALLAQGSPTTLFALRSQLGSHWRVIVKGLHGVDGPGLHRLETSAAVAPDLAALLAGAQDEDAFAAVLMQLSGYASAMSTAGNSIHHVQSRHWAGDARASLLAWPTRIL